MLFDTGRETFESEKERNCYYKFFCGYFFNELVDGWENRLRDFCQLLNIPVYPTPQNSLYQSQRQLFLGPTTHVSFDNYSYLFEGCGEHRGEFADIFLHDRSTRTLVCIEAKLHGDWNYEKDIRENARRVAAIAGRLGNCNAIHCVLIKHQKWLAVQGLVHHPKSQWNMVLNDATCATRFFTWEQFIHICRDTKAAHYLEAQLRRDCRTKYKFVGDWFRHD